MSRPNYYQAVKKKIEAAPNGFQIADKPYVSIGT